jgi:hypothetical protein
MSACEPPSKSIGPLHLKVPGERYSQNATQLCGWRRKKKSFKPPEVANYFYVEERVQTVARSHAHLR